MLAANSNDEDPFGVAIADLLRRDPNPFFVQVGGFDGVSFDPLRPHIVDGNLSGLIVEPIPQYFEKLQALYAGSERVKAINCAISEADGERVIWRFNPEAVERGLLPPHFAGISSFLMEDLLKDTGVLGRSSPNAETTAALRALLQAVPVKCRTLVGLLRDEGVEKVDILQIDTEGYDFIVLQLFDFDLYRPSIVHYEHQHLGPADRDAAEAYLRSYGYRIHREAYDTLGVLDLAAGQVSPRAGKLRALAASLHGEGRSDDALLVLEHLAAAHPEDAETLRQLVRVLGTEGRTLEALQRLAALKAVTPDPGALMDEIRAQTLPAVERFNQHLASGEIEQAERYAAALVDLIPRSPPMLAAALSCNQALGRTQAAAGYATALAAVEPDNVAALTALAEACRASGDAEGEIGHRLALALSPRNETHPLLRLRDLHDVAGLILCRPLTPASIAQLETALAAGREMLVPVEAGSEWEGWERHYRLLLEAIDVAAITGPTPEARDDAQIAGVTAGGAALDAKGLRAAADKAGAQAVFFAAADEAYVELYARWFALSVLKHSDVPCLVVIHVIGGKDRLKAIAKAVRVKDKRLVFTGCDFDAGAVATKVYDAPPKGLIEKPVAHYQSARFQRAGALLAALERPMFISDIDLLLQRGVQDLLERCAACDVAFNENLQTTSAGSRLTANLLLVNPTPAGAGLLRFLRAYLDRELGKPAVTRWIDQVALTLGRHHLALQGQGGGVAYFDTTSDINNVMYPSYQEHPFRFLSLYHGFDTSSLEDNPRVLGEGAAKS